MFPQLKDRKIDNKVKVAIGNSLPKDQIKLRNNDPIEMMNYLREQTYKLSKDKKNFNEFGFDFEI